MGLDRENQVSVARARLEGGWLFARRAAGERFLSLGRIVNYDADGGAWGAQNRKSLNCRATGQF